jgi:hypothetical protein
MAVIIVKISRLFVKNDFYKVLYHLFMLLKGFGINYAHSSEYDKKNLQNLLKTNKHK